MHCLEMNKAIVALKGQLICRYPLTTIQIISLLSNNVKLGWLCRLLILLAAAERSTMQLRFWWSAHKCPTPALIPNIHPRGIGSRRESFRFEPKSFSGFEAPLSSSCQRRRVLERQVTGRDQAITQPQVKAAHGLLRFASPDIWESDIPPRVEGGEAEGTSKSLVSASSEELFQNTGYQLTCCCPGQEDVSNCPTHPPLYERDGYCCYFGTSFMLS